MFDVGMSAMLLILSAPLMVVVALATKLWSPGPVFYGGARIGRHGRPFRMWKFRTMIVDADTLGSSSTADDDARLTRPGRLLRKYKLDELPQLWNVLVGDMSLVGPRPQVAWAVARYSEDEKILLTVRPGITDPASLRFANEGEILRGHPDPDAAYLELIHPEKMRLSVAYVKERSFARDLRILSETVAAPFRRSQNSRFAGHDPTIT
jgi:lipopolysaccharide/colanic/teichoic acid biosynthesis glycosyltransferase